MRTLIAASALVCALAVPALAQTFKERSELCLACHGEKGQSETKEVPSLGGMPSYFMLLQLYLFREKRRNVEPMTEMAKDLTDDDLRTFSEFIAKLPPPLPSAEPADPGRIERAKTLIAQHHCASCHNPDFSGREQMPRLAAQREDYLLKALRDYKSGSRPGYDATMDEVIQPLTDANIVDLAHYLAHFR